MSSELILQQATLDRSMSSPPTRRLRVTYIIGSLRDAGTERQALELMKHLDRASFAVSVILFEDEGLEKIPADIDSYHVLHIPQESSQWPKVVFPLINAVGKLRSQLVAWRPDIVHAFLSGPSILGSLAARLAGVPLFIGSRRSLVQDYRRGRKMAALADFLCFRMSHLNLGNSSAVTNEMIAGGCPADRCYMIYNGVDTVRFRPDVPSSLRTEMGWNDTHVVFGMVANFYAYKRHIDFLRAAVLILRHHSNARFVMVGADYGVRKTIADEANQLDLAPYLQILESQPTPENIFSAIDVLVCSSETEGFSNVLLEAMASGKPVVATNVGGNAEAVLQQETGLLVPCRSPQAIAAACDTLMDRGLRHRMGTLSRERVEQHFSLDRMITSHQRLYWDLLLK